MPLLGLVLHPPAHPGLHGSETAPSRPQLGQIGLVLQQTAMAERAQSVEATTSDRLRLQAPVHPVVVLGRLVREVALHVLVVGAVVAMSAQLHRQPMQGSQPTQTR